MKVIEFSLLVPFNKWRQDKRFSPGYPKFIQADAGKIDANLYQQEVFISLKVETTMDVVIKLNQSVAGKDKLARLVQYSCRALWDSLNAKDEAQSLFIHKLKSLEFILSSFRKCEFALSSIT